jgi:hypothetical protein
MQGDSEYHQLTLKRVIDLSLNRNLTTDTLLTPTAQSLALPIRLIPDAQMKGHHPQNLSGPINVKLIMSYIEPISSRFLTIYIE